MVFAGRPKDGWATASILFTFAGVAAALVSISPTLLWSFQEGSPKNDFVSFYSGAKLALQGSLYDSAVVSNLQATLGVEPNQHKMAFIRPHFYALILHPLTWLDYRSAYMLWQLSSIAGLAGVVFCWRQLGLNLLAPAFAWSVPVAFTLIRGQDTILLLLGISIAAFALRRKRDITAGLVFSLCAIKWSLLLPLPLLFAGLRAWRCAGAFAVGLCLLFGTSFWVAGIQWPKQYLEVLRQPSAAPHTDQMASLNGLLHGLPGAAWMEVIAAVITAGIVYHICAKTRSVSTGLAAVLIGGILVSHHAYLYDCVVLIPALCVLARQPHDRALAIYAIGLLTPFYYLPLLLPPWSRIPQAGLVLLMLLFYRSVRASHWSHAPSE